MPITVLLVDDSQVDRALWKSMLNRQGDLDAEFLEAPDARSAIKLLEKGNIELMLLDYSLPDMTGLEILATLKQRPSIREPAVIIVTGHGDQRIAVAAMKSGVQDYLLKTEITRKSLVRAIYNALDKKNMQRQLAEKNQQLQRELKRHKEIADINFKNALQAAPNAMIVVDQKGKIVFVNHVVERLFGYSQQELVGESVHLLVPSAMRKDHPVHFESYIAEPKKRPMGLHRDLTGQRKGGGCIAVEIGLNPIVLENELHVMASIVDITERKRRERMLHQMTLELERSNRDLERFAYVASHDLQEPLRKITSFAELLRNDYGDRLEGEGLVYLKYLCDSSVRMKNLIKDILALSKMTKKDLTFQPIDTMALVQQVVSNMEAKLLGKQADLCFDALPPCYGNENLLYQLFANLIGNGLKYNHSEAARVQISGYETPDTMVYKIADNGIGIDQNFRGEVFDIFRRLHAKDEYEGTGIGLSICKRIVELHGGQISIEDTSLGGICVVFTLNHKVMDLASVDADVE